MTVAAPVRVETEPIPAAADSALVLVVDDEEKNRRLLRDVLELRGYRVIEASHGEEGLRLARAEDPDVILLDIMMPILDGYAVCRELKADAATAVIPVLMVTALRERSSRLEGIAAGANDFLTKPVDTQDVYLRVRNAVQLKQQHDELRRSYEQLRRVEQMRDRLVHMVVHDMRSPLMIMDMGLQLTELDVQEFLDEPGRRNLASVRSTVSALTEMVSTILDVSKMEDDALTLQRAPVRMPGLIRDAVARLGVLAGDRTLETDLPPTCPPVQGDGALLARVLANLLFNAVKHTPTDGTIRIVLRPAADGLRVEVIDTGRGIHPKDHERVFEKFGQAEHGRDRHSTGLGLTFCRMVIERHAGAIGIQSDLGRGCTIWFTLPADSPGDPSSSTPGR